MIKWILLFHKERGRAMKEKQVFDVTIIGAGPVGLFSAFYGGMRQMSVKIIESLPQVGGQLAALYPEKYIYDVAGFPKIRAQEMIDNLNEQMSAFEQTICLNQKVEKVDKLDDGSFVITTNKEVHYSKSIIITAGNGAFQPRRLECQNALQFEDKNIHYFVNDMNKFAGKDVIVFGGGDSAVDWSLMLEPIAKSVTTVHRRDQFRAHEHSVENLMNSKVNLCTPYIPVDLTGDEHGVKQVVIENLNDQCRKTIDVDDVIVTYGFVSTLGPIKEWGLNIEKNSIVVDAKQETNIPGIFACGDICTYEGKAKLIIVGFGEAPIAINQAKMYADPSAKIGHLHSTTVFSK
jgi:thioredoxin reductase (NADPH)